MLPIAVRGTEVHQVAGFRCSHVNTQSLGQLTSAVLPSVSRHKLALDATQTGNEVLAQLAFGHGIDTVVDCFEPDGALGIMGPDELECASDLKRRPMLGQKVTYNAKEQGVWGQLRDAPGFETFKASSGVSSACIVRAWRHNSRLRCRLSATLPLGETMVLTGNGRGRAMLGACDMARRALLLTHDHDGGSLFRGELFVMGSHDSTLLDGCCN